MMLKLFVRGLQSMEKNIKDFVNLAIGIVKTVQEEAERQYNDLKSAGEVADDDVSKKIKSSVDDVINATSQYQENITSVVGQLSDQINTALAKLNPNMVTEDVKAKLEELSKMATEVIDNVTKSSSQAPAKPAAAPKTATAPKTTTSA